MTYKLTATITHKSFGNPVIKELYFTGDTFPDILASIRATNADMPENNIYNLEHHKRCAFKDSRGVKHSWQLHLMEHLN